MARRFEERSVLITGAASGIGRSAAEAFAREGARVVVSDVDEAAGEAVAAAIGEAGGVARFVRCDVSREAEVRALVEACVSAYGGLSVAVNNAGIGGPMAPLADYDAEAWASVMGVNLTGVFYGLRHQIPVMVAGGGGAIVNVSSILGVVGFASAPAYTTAKHGLMGMTRAAALDYAAAGVRVNTVNPGFIDTPLLERAGIVPGSEGWTDLVGRHPIGRFGLPEEVAAAILFLASDEASFITGTGLLVDGGYTAR